MATSGPYDDWRAFLSDPFELSGDAIAAENPEVEGFSDFKIPESVFMQAYLPDTIDPSQLVDPSQLEGLLLFPLPELGPSEASCAVVYAESLSELLKVEEVVVPESDAEKAIKILYCTEKLDTDTPSEAKKSIQPASNSHSVTPSSSEPASIADSETSGQQKATRTRKRKTEEKKRTETEKDILQIIEKAESDIKEAKKIQDKDKRKLVCNQHSSAISRCRKKLDDLKVQSELQKLKNELAEVKAENAKLKQEIESLKQKAVVSHSSQTQTSFELNFVSEEAQFHVLYSPGKKSQEKQAAQVKMEPTKEKDLLSRSDTLTDGRPIRARRRTMKSYG